MRKLVLLRGAMGVGKSTFVKEKKMSAFTLCPDEIRLMFNSPELTLDYSFDIPQFNNQKVWDLLYYVLEERMKKGEFTIVDATHTTKLEMSKYKGLAEKYRYRVFVVDFTGVPKDEVYKRNLEREELKRVSCEYIDRAYKNFKKESVPSSFKVIKPDEFDLVIASKPRNFDNYKNIHVVGDIHGCFSALKKYFDNYPIKEDDAYIFVGDYFDRGIENYETFMFLSELMKRENMIFLVGNHEDKLYKYACGDEFKLDYDIKKTIEEFESNNISKSNIRGFVKRTSQICYMTFRGKTYLISHGGIPYIPDFSLEFLSTNSFIYGVSKYDVNIDEVYNDFMCKKDDKVYQIHGHRNYHKVDVDEYMYSFNLEGDIENGGHLRVLNLNDDGTVSYDVIKNDVYNANLSEEVSVYNLVCDFRRSKYVYENNLGEDISSFNFTKDAFYNRMWDNLTVRARGLFINTLSNNVVARSYDKFFKVDEVSETSIDEIKNNFVFPVRFYLKYNGFLGILSCVNDELFFASKSTNSGDYVEYFKRIFYKIYDEEKICAIKNRLISDNVSMVFEVIDPVNDPHIIKYEKENLILLDMISNSTSFKKISYSDLSRFGEENDIEVKSLAYTVSDKDEFEKLINMVSEYDYKFNDEYVEGFVIEDEIGLMVKCKCGYYDKWKYIRSKMENALLNNKYNVKSNDEVLKDFISYLKGKYEGKSVELKDLNIISERDEFIRVNKKEC